MTILCHGDCHVWLGSSSLCTCEAHRVAMLFPGYNPYGPHAPKKASATDVPLNQFRAAQAIKDATHLSSNGQRVYSQRMGKVRVYYWDEETKSFGSSFPCDGLPPDAVVIERAE